MTDETENFLTPESRIVAACVDAFEVAWQRETPEMRRFVDTVDPVYRRSALVELTRIDLKHRWRSGHRRLVEDYVREYPELEEPLTLTNLLRAEFEVRSRSGDSVSVDEYHQRFPRVAELFGSTHPNVAPAATTVASAHASSDTVPTAPPSRPGHIGRYRVVRELGQGTFGQVLLCRDDDLHRDVAVKVARRAKDGRERPIDEFQHEARSAARLSHPGIVSVLDFGRTAEGAGYIVFEYVQGTTLADRIARRDYSRDQAVQWVSQVAEALKHAHSREVVHRDIKPGNILIDAQGQARLTDFGLARLDDQFYVDDAGRRLGTVAYMSPEQAAGQSHWATPQTDIYALGAVLYELLGRQRPFRSNKVPELIEQIRGRAVTPPRALDDTIPKVLEDICLKALAKKPEERYATGGDLAAALRQATQPAQAGGASLAWGRQPKTIAAVAVSTLAALAAFLYINSRPPAVTTVPPPQLPVDHSAAPIVPPSTPVEIVAFEIHLWRAGETEFRPLTPGDVPLRQGDKIQLHVTLNRPAYIYLWWYGASGRPQLLWPPADADFAQLRPQKELNSPLDTSKSWPVEPSRLPELALVTVSDRPLEPGTLSVFGEQPLVLGIEREQVDVLAEVSSVPTEGTTRDLGAAVSTLPSVELAPEFDATLRERFAAYRGLLIPMSGAGP